MNGQVPDNNSIIQNTEAKGSFSSLSDFVNASAVKNSKKKWIILSAVIFALIVTVAVVIILLNNSENNNDPLSSRYYSTSRSSRYSSYDSDSSDSMTHDKYCMLYLSVSDVKITHSYNYAYCSGTITNIGNYQIKYVKVKCVFYDYSGKIVDTDWCYAVDSNWLDPGESKTFEMMVRDTYGNISTADVKVVCD